MAKIETKMENDHKRPVVTGERTSRQPHVDYDLLAADDKSTSFIIRFETANPRPRFFVQHRALVGDLDTIGVKDRRELIKTCLKFANHNDLMDASITIPIRRYTCAGKDRVRFYAYIEVPYIDNYLKIYKILKPDIPLWTARSWINEHWLHNDPQVTVDGCYKHSVQKAELGCTVQAKLLTHHYQFPARPLPQRHTDTGHGLNAFAMMPYAVAGAVAKEGEHWLLIEHHDEPLIGITKKHHRDAPWSLDERCNALETLLELVHKYVKHGGCFLCLSLVGPFRFGPGIYHNVLGFLAFPEGIPNSLHKDALKFPQNTETAIETPATKDVVDGNHTNVSTETSFLGNVRQRFSSFLPSWNLRRHFHVPSNH